MSLILLTSITPSDDATFLLSSTFLSLTSVGELKDVWLVSKGMDREQISKGMSTGFALVNVVRKWVTAEGMMSVCVTFVGIKGGNTLSICSVRLLVMRWQCCCAC